MRLTLALIVINFIIFVSQVISPIQCDSVGCHDMVTKYFALTTSDAVNGYFWQFFTYMFLHGDVWHIFVNMLILFVFGVSVETIFGWKKFLLLYLISGIGSAIFYLLLTGLSTTPMLGASGAVFGILTAYAFLFPKSRVIVFPIPVPIPVVVVIIGFVVFSMLAGFLDFMSNIAHFGHLGGIITGVILMLIWRRRNRRESRDFELFWE